MGLERTHIVLYHNQQGKYISAGDVTDLNSTVGHSSVLSWSTTKYWQSTDKVLEHHLNLN